MLNTTLLHRHSIPHYHTINEFLEAGQFRQRTTNPDFISIRLEDTYPSVRAMMPAFRKDFYLIALATDDGNSRFALGDAEYSRLSSYLVFQSPGHILSWQRSNALRGFLVYCTGKCFETFRPTINEEFPFFSLMQSNFFRIDEAAFTELHPYFSTLYNEQESEPTYRRERLCAALLLLLYKCKAYYAHANETERELPQTHILTQQYLRAIQNYYLEKRTVQEYADLLAVTPNHLNDVVKTVTGRNALAHWSEKILQEAKNLLLFTSHDVTEIAFQLNFSGPTSFGKFFKRLSSQTPLEFRNERVKSLSERA